MSLDLLDQDSVRKKLSCPRAKLDVMIEIPKGSRNKYVFDKEKNCSNSIGCSFLPYYPSDYGFILDTLALDGDSLDALVLVWEPTFPGCIIKAIPVGMFKMWDDKGPDEKILCVPVSDPFWNYIESLSDVPPHLLKEIEHFFKIYKELEEKKPVWKVGKTEKQPSKPSSSKQRYEKEQAIRQKSYASREAPKKILTTQSIPK